MWVPQWRSGPMTSSTQAAGSKRASCRLVFFLQGGKLHFLLHLLILEWCCLGIPFTELEAVLCSEKAVSLLWYELSVRVTGA